MVITFVHSKPVAVDKKEDSSITIPEYPDSLKSESLAVCLELIRQPILKLSDLKEAGITKPLFYQWKKAGLIKFQPDKEGRLWNTFSLLHYVVLNIIKILWDNNIDPDKIKGVLELLLDGRSLRDTIDDIITSNGITKQNAFEDSADYSLIHYFISQKKLNPSIPFFTYIEAYIIGAFKLKRPFSIILFDDGKVEMFTTDAFRDMMASHLFNKMLSQTFINISVRTIVDTICASGSNTRISSKVISGNNFIEKLIEKGYSIEDINELFGKRTDIEYVNDSIPNPKKVNIENLIRGKSNQDIFIKVRDGEKKSINRIINKQK